MRLADAETHIRILLNQFKNLRIIDEVNLIVGRTKLASVLTTL
jgi:hypothetical protein